MAFRRQSSETDVPAPHGKLGFNVDVAAIAIALLLAALVRFGVLAPIGW